MLQALLLIRESTQDRYMFPVTQIVRSNISRISKSVHQCVSVGHYLLHPNNREFNQGTRPAVANHRLRALLLTPDLSTHTMLSQYISAPTSARVFFPFQFYSKERMETKTVLGASLIQDVTLNHS